MIPRNLLSIALAAVIGSSSCANEQPTDLRSYGYCTQIISNLTHEEPDELQNLICADLEERLDGLHDLPENYRVMRSENVMEVVRCDDVEETAASLANGQRCYDAIQSYLGISPMTQCIVSLRSRGRDLLALKNYYIGEGVAGCFATSSFGSHDFTACDDGIPEEELPPDAPCHGAHEYAHVFVAWGLPLWLDEGVASYMTSVTSPDYYSLECSDQGWRTTSKNPLDSPVRSGDYVSLAHSREEIDEQGNITKVYMTGACIWQYIDQEFGHDSFRTIMQFMEESRMHPVSFLDDILRPTIGDEGIQQLEERFGEETIYSFR